MKFVVFFIILLSSPSQAGDYGAADTDKLPEAAQWKYGIGEWEVTTRTRNQQGEMQTTPTNARVILKYLPDGITLLSQFIISDEFYSVQIFAYNTDRKTWIGSFVNATSQRWASTESRWIDGQMISLIPRGYSNEEEFMQRSVDTPVASGHFSKSVDRSYDLGETWQEGVFLMDFRRIDSPD